MDFDTLLIAMIGGLVANAIELPIIYYLTRPERLMRRLEDPSEADMASLMAFFSHLGEWLMTPSMDAHVSGAAKDVYRKASPLEVFGTQLATSVVAQIRGVMGATERELQAFNLPKKGEGSLAFFARQLGQEMLPQIKDAAAARVNEILKSKIPPLD
jgi:hypothetical protein